MIRRLSPLLGPALLAALWSGGPAAHAAPRPGQGPRGCGAVVVLVGDQGDWRAPPLKCSDERRVTYDARRATFRTIRIAGATGLNLRGGSVDTGGSDAVAVTVDGSRWVHLTGLAVTRARVGVTLVRGSDYLVDQSTLRNLRSDGVIINQAQRVTIDRNVMADFHPAPGDHPDGIQAFSLAGQVPNRDLVFTNNQITGEAQGIDNFGDAMGTTNVRVEGNAVTSAFWHGITFHGVTNLIVRDNVVKTIPGARQGPRGQAVRTWVNVDNNAGTIACGNRVGDFPSGPGTKRCR